MSARGLNPDAVLEVDGKKLDRKVQETVLATALHRTTEGPSTITITARDPEKRLQLAGYFKNRSEATLDGLAFVACHFKKRVDEYTLEFEDREFNELKEGPKAKAKIAVNRSSYMTLARFVQIQCKRICPHAGFICPQLDEQQPREQGTPAKKSKAKAAKVPAKGIAKGSATLGGQPLTAAQENNVNILLGVVNDLKGNETVGQAIIYAAIGETRLGDVADTYTPNSADCSGVLQEKGAANPHDTKGMAERFCRGSSSFQMGGAISLSKTVSDPIEIAVRVEVPSIWPDNAYAREEGSESFLADAKAIVKAYGGTSGGSPSSSSGGTSTVPLKFELNAQAGSNALADIEGLLAEGKWQFFKIGNDFYLVQEEYLVKTKAVLVLDEDTPGIIDIGWELDRNEARFTQKVMIECRAHMWTPEPGRVVKFKPSVDEEISQGRWFVQAIDLKDTTDNATEVTVIRPEAGKPEKADELKEIASKVAAAASGTSGTPSTSAPGKQQINQTTGHFKESSIVHEALFNLQWIAKQNFPYVKGGGHGVGFGPTTGEDAFGPNVGKTGLDCSGAVSYALGEVHSTSLLSHPYDSTRFESWGAPGKGEHMTVWADSKHVLIEINVSASIDPATNTGGVTRYFSANKPGTTARFYDSFAEAAGHSGMVPRHWPGS